MNYIYSIYLSYHVIAFIYSKRNVIDLFLSIACFTVPGPGDAAFISFKSSLHDFCQRYKLPPPQYITTQMAQGYSAKLKFGGLFFQSSDFFTTRLESEQHAAFEALQGLGLLESGVRFGSGDTERVVSRPGSQLSLSSAGGEARGLSSRANNQSRHGMKFSIKALYDNRYDIATCI